MTKVISVQRKVGLPLALLSAPCCVGSPCVASGIRTVLRKEFHFTRPYDYAGLDQFVVDRKIERESPRPVENQSDEAEQLTN